MDERLITGRQTNRKYIALWSLAALAALGMGFLWERPEMVSQGIAALLRPVIARMEPYQTADTGIQGAAGNTVIRLEQGYLIAEDRFGQVLYTLKTGFTHPVLVSGWDSAVLYEPGEPELILAESERCWSVSVSPGVDAAVPGPDGTAAVITAGSGYETQTRIYGRDGALINQIGLQDRAMAMMAFCEDGTLAGCCVSRQGRWSLGRYGLDSTEYLDIPAEMVYDLKPCGGGVAIWCSRGILFYHGQQTGEYLLAPDDMVDWTCGREAYILARCGAVPKLIGVRTDGSIRFTRTLSSVPIQMALVQDRIYLLEDAGLAVFSANGTQREPYRCNAAAMLPLRRELLLLGDGWQRLIS